MKLYFSGNSPYARRPRMAIREFDLMGAVEEIDCAPLGGDEHVLRGYGPGGKVPGLLTDNGVLLCETLIILNYLDAASGGRFFPKDAAHREFAFKLDGVASLLMESMFYRARENRRDESERSPGYMESERERTMRCYDELESLVDQFGDPVDMAQLSTVASLGYADWRLPDDDWRGGRAKLTAWFEKMMARPSAAETKPIF